MPLLKICLHYVKSYIFKEFLTKQLPNQTDRGVRQLPRLYFKKWAFLYYQLNFELSTGNFECFWFLRRHRKSSAHLHLQLFC